MASPVQYENLDPLPAAPGADACPPKTPATVLEAFGPPSEDETTNLQSMVTAIRTTPRTDLRSMERDTAVEDRALLAREGAKKKNKKKPSTFSSTDESRERKAPKKKMDKLLMSETNTVESQESEVKPRNCKRTACITVSAVFLVIFLVGAAVGSAAIGFEWWTM